MDVESFVEMELLIVVVEIKFHTNHLMGVLEVDYYYYYFVKTNKVVEDLDLNSILLMDLV